MIIVLRVSGRGGYFVATHALEFSILDAWKKDLTPMSISKGSGSVRSVRIKGGDLQMESRLPLWRPILSIQETGFR
jgi:hypothetical protein